MLETDGPLLVCMNHPNSFLDAMIVMVTCKRPFHVLVRADVFEHPLANKLLRSIRLIPIYRMRDGYHQLDKNRNTFEECCRVFEQKGAIIIFPEASCIQERRLRKLQKGAAKLVLAAEEKNNFQLNISCVCVGLNYERLNRFGGFLHVYSSDPFLVNTYKEAYLSDKHEGYKLLTDRIENELREQLFIIDHKEDEYLLESYWKISPGVHSDFSLNKTYADCLNQADKELKETLIIVCKDYFKALKRYSIHPAFLRELSYSKWKQYYLLAIRGFDMVFLFPVFVLGFLTNGLAFFLPEYAAKKKFPEEPEFHSSINVAGAALSFLFLYLIYALLFLFVFRSLFVTIGLLIVFALSGFIAFAYNRRRVLFLSSFQYYIKRRKQVKGLERHTQTLIRELERF